MTRFDRRRTRPGFTLVELLVAAAVCVLIMAILAQAFTLGIDTMRQLRSTGELMDQLRGATNALQADLKANHLLTADGQPVKLSDIRMDQISVTDNGVGTTPRFTVNGWPTNAGTRTVPVNGFFRIRSDALSYPAGSPTDSDGLINGTGTATSHYLHFTSILSGKSDDDYYRAAVPQNGTVFHSTAAEIAYFLEPTPSPPGFPTSLFRLIRRQRLVAVNDTDRRDRPWPQAADEAVIGIRRPAQNTTFLATLAEVTNPSNRLGGTKWLSPTAQVGVGYGVAAATPSDQDLAPMLTRPGEDTILSNVLSFEVQVSWQTTSPPQPGPAAFPNALNSFNIPNPSAFNPSATPTPKTDSPFDTLPVVNAKWNAALAGTSTYDSWSGDLDWASTFDADVTAGTANPLRPPLLIRVQGVQIRLRIWDPKMQNARQVTLVQDL